MLFSKCRHHWVSGVSMSMKPPEKSDVVCEESHASTPWFASLPSFPPSGFHSPYTFLHPYLPPKKSLLHKASLAAHLLHLLHISIAFSLSRSYHQCPLPPHQLIILSPGLFFRRMVMKIGNVFATSGNSAGILDCGYIGHGKCDLGSSLRKCAGFLAILFTGRPPRSIVLFPSETRARVFAMGKSL